MNNDLYQKLLDCSLASTLEIQRLRAALEPFAAWADSMQTLKDGEKVCGIEVRHFRRAAQLLSPLQLPQTREECLSESDNCRKNNPNVTQVCCSLYSQYAAQERPQKGE